MSAEIPQHIDPREIGRPFSREISYLKEPGRSLMLGETYVIDSAFAIKPGKSKSDNARLNIVTHSQTNIVRDILLDKSPDFIERPRREGITTLVLNFKGETRTVFVGDKYAITYEREGSSPSRKIFRISSTAPIAVETAKRDVDYYLVEPILQ